MNLFEITILAIALAMDCLTVSIVSGIILREKSWKVILRMGFLFGFFQAMMPCIGWLGISSFAEAIEVYDHWIAFALLTFLGANMIREAFKPEEEHHFNPARLATQLTLAVATSIDALAVGVSFAFIQVKLWSSVLIIGLTTFVFSVLGVKIGNVFGSKYEKSAGIIGGIILILIGLKILLEHLGVIAF